MKEAKKSESLPPFEPVSLTSRTSDESITSIGMEWKEGVVLSKQQHSLFREGIISVNFPAVARLQSVNTFFYKDFNSIVLLLYCTEHKTIALTRCVGGRDIFRSLPYLTFDESFSYEMNIKLAVKKIAHFNDVVLDGGMPNERLAPFKFTVIRVSEVDFAEKTLKRVVVFVPTTPQFTECCVTKETFSWVSIDELKRPNQSDSIIYTDEVFQLARILAEGPLDNIQFEPFYERINAQQIFTFENNSMEALVLADAGFTLEKCQPLFEEFHEHLYPSLVMTCVSFSTFLIKYELMPEVTTMMDPRFFILWRYLSYALKGSPMNFKNFVLALALCDRNLPSSNLLRLKSMFAFQQQKPDHKFTKITFLRLNSPKDFIVEIDLKGKTVDFKDFSALMAQKEHSLAYFQFPISILEYHATGRLKYHQDTRRTIIGLQNIGNDIPPLNPTVCTLHQPKVFGFATHNLLCVENGLSWNPLPDTTVNIYTLERLQRSQEYSLEVVFNTHSTSSILLNLIAQIMSQCTMLSFESMSTRCFNEPAHFQHIEMLLEHAKCVLADEPPFIRIPGPTIVFGSINGSIFDLLQIHREFFPPAYIFPARLVFLGNFTSKDFEYSLEVLVFLFALKVHLPNSVYLIRGMNECAGNNQYLHDQLVKQYGAESGNKLYGMFVKLFDCLSYGAVINERILAVHSGIPNLKKTIAETMKEDSSENQSSLKQCVYNIPLKCANETSQPIKSGLNDEGYVGFHEIVPGQPHAGHYFNRRALHRFLKFNEFDRIIRAGNPRNDSMKKALQENGFSIGYERTVFSISTSSLAVPDAPPCKHIACFKIEGWRMVLSQLDSLRAQIATK